MDDQLVPLVDCCHVDEADRVPRAGVSPYAIHPNPLHRPFSRRRVFRTAAAVGTATAGAIAVACGGGDDAPAASQATQAISGQVAPV